MRLVPQYFPMPPGAQFAAGAKQLTAVALFMVLTDGYATPHQSSLT